MNLSGRIRQIILENQLKQKEFAAEIGVTESYISALLNNRNLHISQPLASLIEEKYGYCSSWIINGTKPERKDADNRITLSEIHKRAIFQIKKLSPEQIKAVLAFMNSLEEIEQSLKDKRNEVQP